MISRIRVPHQRYAGQFAAAFPQPGAMGSELAKLTTQVLNPAADRATVFFQLRLARSAGADAPALAREAQSTPRQSRQSITQLCQFTCSRPAALEARCAKMSRISSLRSVTGLSSSRSRLRA